MSHLNETTTTAWPASALAAAEKQHRGRRAPHKPLLVLLALGRLANTGASRLRWTETEPVLGRLISEFGTPSTTGAAQRAAYPFTHLRSDGVWTLDHDEVPMGSVRALSDYDVVGQLERSLEDTLRADTQLLYSVARTLVDSHFPAPPPSTNRPAPASPAWDSWGLTCCAHWAASGRSAPRPVGHPRGEEAGAADSKGTRRPAFGARSMRSAKRAQSLRHHGRVADGVQCGRGADWRVSAARSDADRGLRAVCRRIVAARRRPPQDDHTAG
jgi:hypothetical protein